MKGFSHWLVSDRRTGSDPLAGLSGVSTSEDVRRGRRALSPEEFGRILDAALVSDRVFRGVDGRERHHLYLTACAAGFRTHELASLTPNSFNLDGDTPTATVPSAYTKNGKTAVQPIPGDVAGVLRTYLRTAPASDRDR